MGEPTTRQRLIAAAFTVVARDGLDRASVKSIAAEAGVNPGLTHYHFPTKDALLEAALRDALAGYLERLRWRRLNTPRADQLRAFFADAWESVTREADFFRVRLSFATKALSDPALASTLKDLNAAAIAEAALTLAAAAGREAPTVRDTEVASMLKATFDGLMLAWLLDPEFPLAAARARIEESIEDWLRQD